MSATSGIDPNASDYLLDGALDPHIVTVDKDFNPGILKTMPLKLVCIQYKRTWSLRSLFGKGGPTNWIYQVGNLRYLVYKPFPLDRVVTIMGFMRSSRMWHPNAVPMEDYCKYILDKVDPAWLDRNNFVTQ